MDVYLSPVNFFSLVSFCYPLKRLSSLMLWIFFSVGKLFLEENSGCFFSFKSNLTISFCFALLLEIISTSNFNFCNL